ncbi:MAG: hypothetical protein ACKPKO_65335, partial [Candidatus Fonsibacter sp.]
KQILQCRDTVMQAIRSHFLDSKAHTTYYGKFYDKPTLTHQYDNNAKNENLNNNICINHSSYTSTILSFIQLIFTRTRRRKKDNPDTHSNDNDTIRKLVKDRDKPKKKIT